MAAIKIIGLISGIIIISVLVGTSCKTENLVKGQRYENEFSKIRLEIPADLYLKQGINFKINIEADDEVLKKIKTEVNSGTLTIKRDIKNLVYPFNKVIIYIEIPEVSGLIVSGSGSIFAETPVNTKDIEFDVNGSGEITINNLNASIIRANISGSGEISLKGDSVVEKLNLKINGSGDYKAENLKIKTVDATINGSGDAKVYVEKELNANVHGSGNIGYYGKPVVNAKIFGSGKTRSMN